VIEQFPVPTENFKDNTDHEKMLSHMNEVVIQVPVLYQTDERFL